MTCTLESTSSILNQTPFYATCNKEVPSQLCHKLFPNPVCKGDLRFYLWIWGGCIRSQLRPRPKFVSKAPCDWEMIEGRTLRSLPVKTFARILYVLPSKLIGLKSFKWSTPFFFEIRMMNEAPACLRRRHLEWKRFMKAIISPLVSSQNHWENTIKNLSGPSALLPPKLNTAAFISSISKALSNQAAFSSPILAKDKLLRRGRF